MRRSAQQDNFKSQLFGLTHKSVEFRNRVRGIAGGAAWLLLSGFTMLLTVWGVQENLHIGIVIGMSFLKYIPFLIVVYSLARKMSAGYLDDVYELHDKELASAFLEEVTFGSGREKITINEGKINEKDEKSPIILIGGPGKVQVNLDSVALLEAVDGEPKVIYPQKEAWKLGRFERIREIGKYDELGKREYAIINLRDQFVTGLTVKARTKDGIPIEAHGIKVIFSILRRQKSEGDKVQADAYLFDERAVQALVYNQTIITPEPSTPSGVTFPWDTSIIPLIISELEKLITSRTLSEILATVSQVEIDHASTNDQTIAQMRVEMTGQQSIPGVKKESTAPNFESRARITAQFFEDPFKAKAATLGLSIQWIDIGTWQLPSSLILEKHKEAWNLSRENAKKRAAVERSGKQHEVEEIVHIVDNVVIANYETERASRSPIHKEKEMISKDPEDVEEEIEAWETFFALNPDIKNQFTHREANKKDATTMALEMLKAFRKELLAGKLLIEKENKPQEEKQAELAKIDKALYDISHLTNHWIQNPS